MFEKAKVADPLASSAHWWLDAPSRQSTGGSTLASTAASETDLRATPQTIGRRLEGLKEQRGWKHFFRHVAIVPIAFAGGLLLGGMAVGLVFAVSSRLSELGRWKAGGLSAPYVGLPAPSEVPTLYSQSPPLNNSCLIQKLAIPEGPRTFDACAFVIRSTDEVWNLRGNVDEAIERYFHENYLDAGSWGRRIIGKKALRDAVLAEMRAFPDIRIHITDCMCGGNDLDGYKCVMPDVLDGTNLGPSAYGPATGRYARWTGMVQSLVKKNEKTGQWQYWAEWGVHDEWALIQQLGLDFSRVPHPPSNPEPLHDCTPLQRFTPEALVDDADAQDMQAAISSRIHR